MSADREPALPDFDRLWNYDDPAETERRFGELVPAAAASGDISYRAELLTQIARTQALQRRFEDAHRTLDGVEPLLPSASERARIRYVLERGRTLNSSGRQDEARPLFEVALQLAQERGEDFYVVDAAHMIAIVETPDGSLEWNLRAIELARSSADGRARGWLGSLYNNLGWTYHDLGRFEDALATFQQGLTWQQEAGKEREARIASWTVARALRSLGRFEEALARQEENLRELQQSGERDGYTEEEIGECLLALGRGEEAAGHFARAHTILSEDPWLTEAEPERLRRLAALGQVEA